MSLKKLFSVQLLLTLTVILAACTGEEVTLPDTEADDAWTLETEPVSEPSQGQGYDSVSEPSHEADSEIETTWEPELSWESGSVELEEPWVYCRDDMVEAVEIAGFTFNIPPLSNFTVAVIPGEMIRVTFPRDEFDSIVVCKSPCEPEEGDISGDHSEYPETGLITVNKVDVSVRRDGDIIYVATFTSVDGTYCVSCTAGMTETEVTQILAELMEVNS